MNQLALLNNIVRKEPTHKIVIDMLKEDMSIKTVELLFDGYEEWQKSYALPGNIAELILARIRPLMDNDSVTIAWKATSYQIKSGKIMNNWYTEIKVDLNNLLN